MRLASVLPLELSTRQSLLELDDPLLRLDALRDYLAAQGLGAA
nr:peptidase S16 [Zoogloeaceae bacterium]